MGWIIWGVVLPSCVVSAWLIVRKPLRQVVEELGFDQGRLQFRQQREWLEARFLTALGRVDPIERLRWEAARWHDQVHWARDHQTRRLIALVEVHFEPDPFDTSPAPDLDADHATALFEYRKGRWCPDGKRLDATRPDEALLRHARFDRVTPVSPPQRRACSLADLGLHVRPPADVFLQVELFRAAEFQQGFLEPFDLGAGVEQLVGDLPGDQADAVLVGVDQLAGEDLDPRQLDRLGEVDQPDVSVTDARVEAEELEAEAP